jgi:hypothetical protein
LNGDSWEILKKWLFFEKYTKKGGSYTQNRNDFSLFSIYQGARVAKYLQLYEYTFLIYLFSINSNHSGLPSPGRGGSP